MKQCQSHRRFRRYQYPIEENFYQTLFFNVANKLMFFTCLYSVMSTPVRTWKISHKWTDEMKYSKGKKGSGILTNNGTKKTATNLFVLFSEE